ncbi:MAG: hypothetical protein SOZ30_03720 [Roseburia lenta]|nr:hypothetical protein [Roseburia lenta]
MKLISCYITGFGTIKEWSYDFSDGMNALCQENGWGKTTFSVFLKAMFYGMDYSARTKMLTERKHYMPWDGGVCGGYLIFEAEGKRYRVERSFGKTDKDDTFTLIDTNTGAACDDFSQNLGEELFQVDRDSFEKSIFIPQASVSTAMTDSLNAKMGNLASAKDDINNFDEALNRVSEVRKNYTRRSKVNNGKINVIKEEISRCSEVIDKKAAILDGYRKQFDKLEEKKKSLNWMEAEKNRITEAIRTQSKREQDMGAYRQQKEFLEKQQEEMNVLDDFFATGLPSEEEHAKLEDVERQYDMSRRTEKDLAIKLPPEQQIKKWEDLFGDQVPDEEDLAKWKDMSARVQELRMQGEHSKLSEEATAQLDQLKYSFANKVPTEEELSQIEKDVVELSRLDGRIVEQDENYRNIKARVDMAQKTGRTVGKTAGVLVLFILFAALLLGGFSFRILAPEADGSTIYQILCFVGAAATGVAAIMQIGRIRSLHRNKQEDLQGQLAEAAEALAQSRETREVLAIRCKAFLADFKLTPADSMQQMVYEIRVNLDHYVRLRDEEHQATAQTTDAVEEMADLRMELYTILDRYAQVYHMDLYHEGNEADLLEQLKKDKNAYEEYIHCRKQLELIRLTMEEQKRLLEKYLGRFPLEEGTSLQEQLHLIRSKRQRYGQLQEEIGSLQEKIQTFAEDNQVEEIALSVEQLQEKQVQIDEEIKDMQKGITQDRESLHQLSVELDGIEDAENRRDVLMEEKAECDRKVDLLTKTEEFLKIAKEQFLSTYMRPLRQGMEHYMAILDDKYKDSVKDMDFDITMDLSVQVLSQGSTHSSDYLSHGYQDLVGLCARFALVDVLYHKEQPVIVLDDPFTNLDQQKIAHALKLLADIAKERQIVYFTCHESRMPS